MHEDNPFTRCTNLFYRNAVLCARRNNTIGFLQSHNLINIMTVIMIVQFPGNQIGMRNDKRAGRNSHVKWHTHPCYRSCRKRWFRRAKCRQTSRARPSSQSAFFRSSAYSEINSAKGTQSLASEANQTWDDDFCCPWRLRCDNCGIEMGCEDKGYLLATHHP